MYSKEQTNNERTTDASKPTKLSQKASSDFFFTKRKRSEFEGFSCSSSSKKIMNAQYVGCDDNEKLMIAVKSGLVEECQLLLRSRVDINYKNKEGKTFLSEAIRKWVLTETNKEFYEEIIGLLIQKGADPTRIDWICNDEEKIKLQKLLENSSTRFELT